MPPVLIRLENDLVTPERVGDVSMEVYTTDGSFVTSGTTDENGEVSVLLPEAFYDLMFFKQGVSILPRQPQRIEVIDPLEGDNSFLVSCHERVLPESSDPRKCRASGYLLRADGAPTRTRLVLHPVADLIVLGSDVVAPQSQADVSSDESGYFEFDLLRGIRYTAHFVYLDTLLSMTPGFLDVIVPDQAGIEIDKLLFPVPVSVTFSLDAISLVSEAADDLSITFEVTYSDGSVRHCPVPWTLITFSSSDDSIVQVGYINSVLCLTPMAAGVATITAERTLSSSTIWNPTPEFVTESIVVTVS